MKQYISIIKLICGIIAASFFMACSEDDFSKDYDIELPVSEIIDFDPKTEFVGKEVTLYGENLDIVTSVSIGNITCKIISQEEGNLVFQVARTAETGNIVISNKYKRSFTSSEPFIPKYLDVVVKQWPTEIEKGLTINISGDNVDMIHSVKFENIQLSKASASPTTATYSTANLTLPPSGKLTVTSKTGQILTSAVINVVEPKDTYIPSASIMLFDFDVVEPTIVAGNPTGAGASFTAGKNLGDIVPFFGNYYSVIAPRGNAWNGQYQMLETTNGGKGFDLSNYTSPYITFLVNTNGNKGYFNPAITIGGSESDKHFTGQDGEYKDNYSIQTNGWEWRSYNLEGMGFSNIKSEVDKISLWFRGGNVGNNDAYEIHIDQVMITDGPLNPVLVFDMETMPTFSGGSASQNRGSGVTVVPQGNKYLTVKDANVGSWANKGNIKKTANDGSKFDLNKTFYINFLVTTGSDGASGYFQMIFEQTGGTKLGHHFKGDNPYKDDYKFADTHGKWQWRSYKIDPKGLENWGDVPELDLNTPFDLTIDYSTGNVSGKYEMNLDYVILTSVPLDTTIR